MARIAYIVSTLKRCGPNSQLHSIIRHLDRTEFEPLVITLSPEPADSIRPLFEQDGIPVDSLNLSRVEGLFVARRKLRNLLKEKGVGLLHTQGVRADSLAASLRREWPAVCSVRNFPQLDYPMTYGKLRGHWMAYSHARALSRVASPVGVSAAVSQNLKTCFGVQARTIRNGVDTAVWTPAAAEERASLRRKLGWMQEGTVWVSTGHLSERKDPLTVIRAFRQTDMQDAQLVFLGSGPLEAECRVAAAGCEQIVFSGRVDNVADYLRAADGFVSASHAEGFPNAVLEAMACGLPCVLSDIPPHREIAEQAGACISLFPVDDAQALAGRFHVAETMREAARFAAQKNFSAAAMSAHYQVIYRELLS
jgi:glycosyltransferase involved in cell wall biosynthesis